jgi:hypothetical protein
MSEQTISGLMCVCFLIILISAFIVISLVASERDELKQQAVQQWRDEFKADREKLIRERDEARKESLEQARLLGISGERECRLIAERDEAKKKYDIEATEHMLNINKCCNQRDAAMDALMKIEEIFIDGDDTYEDWKSMGQIARTFLENKI